MKRACKVFLHPEPWFGGGCSPQAHELVPRELDLQVANDARVLQTVAEMMGNEIMPEGRSCAQHGPPVSVGATIARHGAGHDGPYKLSVSLFHGNGQPDMFDTPALEIGVWDAQQIPAGNAELTFGELGGYVDDGPWTLECRLVEDSLATAGRDACRLMR